VIGWCLSRSLEADMAPTALQRVLHARAPVPGWLHPSDRGVPYACRDHIDHLKRQAPGLR